MSPVLTPTLLDPVAETLELSETELGRLFGVSQAGGGPVAGARRAIEPDGEAGDDRRDL